MWSVVCHCESHHAGVKVLHLVSISNTEANMANSGFGLSRHGELPVSFESRFGFVAIPAAFETVWPCISRIENYSKGCSHTAYASNKH